MAPLNHPSSDWVGSAHLVRSRRSQNKFGQRVSMKSDQVRLSQIKSDRGAPLALAEHCAPVYHDHLASQLLFHCFERTKRSPIFLSMFLHEASSAGSRVPRRAWRALAGPMPSQRGSVVEFSSGLGNAYTLRATTFASDARRSPLAKNEKKNGRRLPSANLFLPRRFLCFFI